MIGNRTTYSAHLYGGAADIYLDADGDGLMDDLTGDGLSTYADAAKLAEIIESFRDAAWYRQFLGGLSV